MSDPTPPLHYAPPPLQRRRRLNRGLLAGIVLVLIGLPVLIFNGAIIARVQLLYQERAAANYAPASDYPVFEEQPAAVEKLLKNAGYTHTGNLELDGRYTYYGANAPQDTLLAYLARMVPFIAMQRSVHDTTGFPLAFSGIRTRPDGTRRLVMVIGRLGSRSQFICAWFVIDRAGLFGKPMVVGQGNWPDEDETRNGAQFLPFRDERIFAGQRDPSNPCKFDIETVVEGVHHHTVGELTNADTIRLESVDSK